ncbi:hypothetical protein [Scytonema sp. NUACC26]
MKKNNRFLDPHIPVPAPLYTPNKGGKVGHETLFSETGLMHPGSC